MKYSTFDRRLEAMGAGETYPDFNFWLHPEVIEVMEFILDVAKECPVCMAALRENLSNLAIPPHRLEEIRKRRDYLQWFNAALDETMAAIDGIASRFPDSKMVQEECAELWREHDKLKTSKWELTYLDALLVGRHMK
jgi:hypothetical protein